MSDNGNEAQFVTLGIEHEVFAVPVDIVQEILDMRPVCRMPEAPAHVAGLIDVRAWPWRSPRPPHQGHRRQPDKSPAGPHKHLRSAPLRLHPSHS